MTEAATVLATRMIQISGMEEQDDDRGTPRSRGCALSPSKVFYVLVYIPLKSVRVLILNPDILGIPNVNSKGHYTH